MLGELQALFIVIIAVVMLIEKIRNRNLPRLGGKLGRRLNSTLPVPEGFSRIERRAVTHFTAATDAADYRNLRAFLLKGIQRRQARLRIYRVAGCETRIEIPDEIPGYERIDADEALALLRELPDLRLVHRLHLRDDPAYLDPWIRKMTRPSVFLLGNATSSGLVVLYLPDRRQIQQLGLTLLHEWLHLLGFASTKDIGRFKRANKIEPLPPPAIEPVAFGNRRTAIHEAWSDLGEVLLGYDDALAREAALAAPVHAMILWRRVERVLRKTPSHLRSTRATEFEARALFMQNAVAPKARAARAAARPWHFLS